LPLILLKRILCQILILAVIGKKKERKKKLLEKKEKTGSYVHVNECHITFLKACSKNMNFMK